MKFVSKQTWELDAKCNGANWYSFTSDDIVTQRKQRTACIGCPVRVQCRLYAVVHEEHGVWGGTTTSERANIPAEAKNLLRYLFLQAGLLERNPHPVLLEEFAERHALQLPGQNVPNDDLPHE